MLQYRSAKLLYLTLKRSWGRRGLPSSFLSSFVLPEQRNQRVSVRLVAQDSPSSRSPVIDCDTSASSVAGGNRRFHLPDVPKDWQEFPTTTTLQYSRALATARILDIAGRRVMEPPTLHLLAAAACATLSIGAVEAALLCQLSPLESYESARFVAQYAIQNLFPSVVWETQEATLVCTATGLDPTVFLRDLSGTTPESAILLLQTHWLSTSRFFFAGFMMIAQLFRAASITIESFDEYAKRVELGQEPPLHISADGLVTRFCGRDSHVSEVSLKRMGSHLFPVFEHPERVGPLVRRHSEGLKRPVYWCVPPGLYWSKWSWEKFPVDVACLITGRDGNRFLVLEADATNGNDPLSIGQRALDLTLEDASQGFRRILDQYRQQLGLHVGRDFSTLRVYLGNSMELTTTGGGYSYTLRHRIRYAKEMDVLIDSRAPVLQKILEWCHTVAREDRQLFFQTSSREYFLNLQTLLREYGYEIYDPLDLRMLHKLREGLESETSKTEEDHSSNTEPKQNSFLNVLFQDADADEHGDFLKSQLFSAGIQGKLDDNDTKESKDEGSVPPKNEMLRRVARLCRLPRLVHMETTAETVNAVEALIAAGEVDASSCCALLDREEGVAVLEATLQHRSGLVESKRYQWRRKEDIVSPPETLEDNEQQDKEAADTALHSASGLQIICSSTIHADVLRQVRWWARQGHSATEIQREIDSRYQVILEQSHTAQQQVFDTTTKEKAENTTEPPPDDGEGSNEEAVDGNDSSK